jgi:uncharacterized phage infection (PIP) family protein YhgE
LKRALSQLGAVNERMLEKNKSLKLSARSANDLVEQHEATRDNLESTIVQSKTKLSSCQFQIDQLKKEETFYRESSSKFELTASQLGKEIENLKAEMKIQEDTFSFKISDADDWLYFFF